MIKLTIGIKTLDIMCEKQGWNVKGINILMDESDIEVGFISDENINNVIEITLDESYIVLALCSSK